MPLRSTQDGGGAFINCKSVSLTGSISSSAMLRNHALAFVRHDGHVQPNGPRQVREIHKAFRTEIAFAT